MSDDGRSWQQPFSGFLVHRARLFEHLLDLRGQQGVFRGREQRVLGQQSSGFALGRMEGAGVVHQVGDLQRRQTVLAAAEKVAGAAGLQIVLGHREAVCRGAEELEPLLNILAGVVADEEAPASAAPRPTRPRSWCRALRPYRSAFSMTMTVALGTSTPTSMTVVDTSASSRPALKSSMTAAFSFGLSSAVHQAHPALRQRALAMSS